MTTEIMKQNLINSIMDLDAENPYKRQLLEIMQCHREKRLTDVDAYFLINDIIVDYDFNVIMPYERKIIEERRKEGLEKSGELLSDIPIQNPEDVTEVAIKTKTEIGKIFLDGFNELFNLIGIENLGMKDRRGNSILELKGGKQKAKAQEIIKQYTEIIKRPDLKRYAIQQADIFEIPILKEMTDGRGKKGFYKDRIMPIMVKYLLLQGNINTSIDKLSKNVGLVGRAFKDTEFEYELMINNKPVTAWRIRKFYSYCRPEQERIIFNTLDALQNDYSVITYEKNFLIINIDDSERTSTKDEDIIIRNVQRKVLDEFGVSRIFTIYQKGEKTIKKFYDRVCEILNSEFKFDCNEYYNQIQIYADMEGLKKLDSKLNTDNEKSKILKNEIRQHFLSKIKDKIKSDYEYSQKSADRKDEENQKEWLENTEYKNHIPKDIQTLLDAGMYSDIEVKEMVLPKPKPAYRYPENHVEVLSFLCDCFLADI